MAAKRELSKRDPLIKRPRPRQPSSGLVALLSAVRLLRRHSEGSSHGWTLPHAEDPIAFLLDAMSDPVRIVLPDGHVVFRNHAASGAAKLDDAHFTRRAQRLEWEGGRALLEVFVRRGGRP